MTNMLTEEERSSQRDIAEAYKWVFRVTEEVGALLNDSVGLMRERDMEDVEGLRTYYGQKVPPDSWPCVYYLARVFQNSAAQRGDARIFLGISVGNPRADFVPELYAGTLRRTGEDAIRDRLSVITDGDMKFHARMVGADASVEEGSLRLRREELGEESSGHGEVAVARARGEFDVECGLGRVRDRCDDRGVHTDALVHGLAHFSTVAR